MARMKYVSMNEICKMKFWMKVFKTIQNTMKKVHRRKWKKKQLKQIHAFRMHQFKGAGQGRVGPGRAKFQQNCPDYSIVEPRYIPAQSDEFCHQRPRNWGFQVLFAQESVFLQSSENLVASIALCDRSPRSWSVFSVHKKKRLEFCCTRRQTGRPGKMVLRCSTRTPPLGTRRHNTECCELCWFLDNARVWYKKRLLQLLCRCCSV